MRFLLHGYGFCVTSFIGANTPINGEDMYLDLLVNIPISPGKITYRRKNGVDYVYYEYAHIYDKSTKKTNPKGPLSGRNPRLSGMPLNECTLHGEIEQVFRFAVHTGIGKHSPLRLIPVDTTHSIIKILIKRILREWTMFINIFANY